MKNYLQPGKNITVPAAADTVAGAPVVMGSLKGFASNSALTGEDLTISREGVYSTTIKAAGTAWAIGDKIYLKADGTEFNKTASGNTLFGFAAAAAASGDTVAEICLADAL